MIISVASGKGGTGKTMVAVNLAVVLGPRAQYLDCDVEEPNGHIFLKPKIDERWEVEVPIPTIDYEKCNFCGKCQEVCLFNAIAVIQQKKVMVFPELCHSCGACWLFCPTGAISEASNAIGIVESGSAGDVAFVHGRLNVGEPLAPPIIKEVHKSIDKDRIAIVDSPPGTSCAAVEAVNGSDYCLLVTEPTPFGLNDLELAVEMLHALKVPFSVIINRCDIGDERVEEFCSDEDIRVVMRIPHDMRIARTYSRGELIVETIPEYSNAFKELFRNIEVELQQGKVSE